nr:flagellar hook-length control protein FliK [uncultured Sulfurimonas sp.]
MILLQTSNSSTKADTATSSPLSLLTSQKEPTLSFSELLKGAGSKDEKLIQNTTLVLALEDEKLVKADAKNTSKNETLISLLKGKDAKGIKESDLVNTKQSLEQKESLELNPKITQNMSVKEVKTLIADAKEYLKSKILESDGYKQAQTKELPKTLKGLATLAKNYGIDLSKISIEEVQVKTTPILNDTNRDRVLKSEKVEVKTTTQTLESEKVEVKTTTQTIENVKTSKVLAQTEFSKNQDKNIVEEKKVEVKQVEVKQVLDSTKQTPLFKAQDAKEHTTQQIVRAREFKIEEKTPKEKADETLKLLLRGEKPSATNSGLTADLSLATAKVIAPSANSDASKILEKLLHGETSSENTNTNTKTETSGVLKSDSFEVKLNEAKQMIKYISQDVKNAIEDYKSPFTRVKVQLNPQKLGEVDLTIIQRGKNLHVNISSNNTAINTLSMNANELRTQLNNNGINNASLNFNNSSQNSDQNANHQQNRQNEQRATKEYDYFEKEQNSEEILSYLEIVVPNYA